MTTWTTAKVMVSWTPGRDRSNLSQLYQGVAVFDTLSENPWSVLLVFDNLASGVESKAALVTLLANWAPRDLLRKGVQFRIIEGPNTAALVEVLEDGRQVDKSPL